MRPCCVTRLQMPDINTNYIISLYEHRPRLFRTAWSLIKFFLNRIKMYALTDSLCITQEVWCTEHS